MGAPRSDSDGEAEAEQGLAIVMPAPRTVAVVSEPVALPGPGQVRVRATTSLVSIGTELTCWRGEFEPGTVWSRWVRYPFSPGYSHVGVVDAVGDGVTALRPGDRVVSRSPHRQWLLDDPARFVPVPHEVSDEEAAWFGLACITQIGVRHAEAELGAVVVVVGLGPLGQLLVQYARLAGAREVIAVNRSAARRDLAARLGATAQAASLAEAEELLTKLTDGRLADLVYDATGDAAALAPSTRLLRRFGKLVLVGDPSHPSEQRLGPEVLRRGIQLVGAHASHPPHQESEHAFWTHRQMTRLFFTYVVRGQLRVRELNTHRESPRDAAAVYERLAAHRSDALGVLFDWTRV